MHGRSYRSGSRPEGNDDPQREQAAAFGLAANLLDRLLYHSCNLPRKHGLRLLKHPVPEPRDVQGPQQRQKDEEEREEKNTW